MFYKHTKILLILIYYTNQFGLPFEVIVHIVQMYQIVPSKPTRVFEVSFNAKDFIFAVESSNSHTCEISLNKQYGILFGQSLLHDSFFHIVHKNINTFFCRNDGHTLEITRSELIDIVKAINREELLLYYEGNRKLYVSSGRDNIVFSIFVKCGGPSCSNFFPYNITKYEKASVLKNRFDQYCQSLQLSHNIVRLSIKDGIIEFDLEKHGIQHRMNRLMLEDKYKIFKEFDIYCQNSKLIYALNINNNILYVVISH